MNYDNYESKEIPLMIMENPFAFAETSDLYRLLITAFHRIAELEEKLKQLESK